MNGFGSECSSGCESGWTMYLDHSSQRNCGGFVDENGFFCEEYKAKEYKEEEDEEDLSMVSDASSGPPHCHEDEEFCDENGCFSSSVSSATALAKKTNKRQKIKSPTKNLQQQQQQYHSVLDDTASSAIFSFSKSNVTLTKQQASRDNVIDFSQGFSATQFNERYTFQRNPDFLQSSLPGKTTSAKPVGSRKGSGNKIW
ncbi:hypothetical protein AQUCO_06000049v1 [Aquilegia coerulea]|uniref:Uncharacterized protein n=1 Tax=Aquilegia coerulea TaxID=218851 RepID=A0A2G5CDP3_AQUCA|nr:hypothetical protein AQUCO_06000049v1 [Aquilegia coerulea]